MIRSRGTTPVCPAGVAAGLLHVSGSTSGPLPQTDFDAIADQLNGRPRQTLGFKTPSQALAEVLR